MTAFWVYENWRADGHRATIHTADCSHCKGGVGQSGGTAATNGRWLGPFDNLASADAAGLRAGADGKRCGHCLRGK